MRESIEGDLNKSPAGDKSLGVVMKKTDDPALHTVDKRATPVTDQGGIKPTKTAVAESEVRYRRLFETAKDGILILDADTGMITEANPYLQAMLGYSHAELLGRTLWEIGPFKDAIASREAFRELQVKEYVRYENLPLETKYHERRAVEFVSNVYLVDGTKVIQCNIRDITERKQAEDNARKVNEDLVSLVAELRRRDSTMQLLSDMNELLQSCTTQEEAFQVIAMKAGQLFVGQSGYLAVTRPREQYLEEVAHWGPDRPVMSPFQLEDCWALRRGHPHEVIEPNLTVVCRHFATPPTTGYLCVPLTVQGDTLGVLCLIGTQPKQSDAQLSQLHVVLTVGETIKLVLSNLKLRESLRVQANHDPLTGLFNRRYLADSLSRELSLSLRRGATLCVAVLDLDHFKRFNDTFGHDAGDLALREAARVMSMNLRKSDIACRLGGEEFALVLPDSSLAGTLQRVEQICALVKQIEIRHGGHLLGTMTLSAGIAGSPEHATTARELLRAADIALFSAKRAGREQVVLYEPADTERPSALNQRTVERQPPPRS
jgi:diguanylate cyclase (GGDEF)-like protein/PAS domain S-box-containing protein